MSKTVPIPKTVEELEEMLNDESRMSEVWGDKGKLREWVRNYAAGMIKDDPDLVNQLETEVQRVTMNYLRETGAVNTPVNLGPHNNAYRGREVTQTMRNAALFNDGAPGAGLNELFKGSADYLRTVWHDAQNRGIDTARRGDISRIQNAFGSTVPADGGFLIPETLRSEILMIGLETAIVRPRATVIPMESLRVPIPIIDSTSNVSSVFGGIVCYWTEEAATLTESSPNFGRVVLDAKKLTAYAEMPNELIADATAFGGFFDRIFPRAMAFYEDYAFIAGTGVSEPLGFLSAPATVSVAKESSQNAATIVWQNVVKMYSRMLPTSLGNAVWLVAPDTFPELATMALTVGTGGGPVWLNNGAAGPPMTILGRPVIVTEKLPTVGTTGDIIFADLSYYLIGDRQAMVSSSSPHYKFGNDKTAFRLVERVDGRPWLQSAITPKNNASNTLSAFVQLATRA